MADTMRAVQIEQFGGPESLQLRDVRRPTPGEGEMLVRVRAAGVNPVDYKIREGRVPFVTQDKLPYIPGRDVAGEVVECAPDVKKFSKGDRIFAMPGFDRGGYAQYVLIRENEAAPKPALLDDIGAGATPLAALTAWQGLFRHGELKAGQRVLIQGGSGGVGHFAIQFAKARGAYVATTVSSANVGFAKELGADQVIDYKHQRFEDAIERVDMVFDLVGGETQDRSWAVLKSGGVLVSTLTPPSPEIATAHRATGKRYTTAESGSELAEIGKLIDEGKVKPHIAKTFRLEEAGEAQKFLETQRPAGKVVLAVG